MTEHKDEQLSEMNKELIVEVESTVMDEQAESPIVESDAQEAISPSVTDQIEYHFAGFWMRFWAYIVDIIVIGSINRMIVKPILNALDVSPYGGLEIFSPYTIGYVLVFFLYFVLMTKFFKQTLGKMVFGLKVISLKQDRLTWGTIVFREFIGRFISKTIWITYALVGILPKKQGLHDLFADTTVVLEKSR